MAKKEDTARQQRAIQEMREAITKYGRAAGEALIRERYPDVSRSTWLRWRKAVVVSPIDIAAERIRDALPTAADVLPAAPSPAMIARNRTEGGKTLDFMARFEELYGDAELLRDYASGVDADGHRKVKIPTFFAQSIGLRSNLLERWIQAMNLMFDAKHMQGLYEAIVEEIGAADPEIARRIMERLALLNEERGFTLKGRV